MRCHCPHCETETWMVHSERDNACVCPQCLYRCYACQGTGTAMTKEEIAQLKAGAAFLRPEAFDADAQVPYDQGWEEAPFPWPGSREPS